MSPAHTLRAARRRRREYNRRNVNPFRRPPGAGWAPCPSCGGMSNGEHRRECKGVRHTEPGRYVLGDYRPREERS